MKRKKSSSSPSFSLLPNEITENFLARVPRSYYPRLSLVSKRFRSILSSTDLYIARSRLGSTEQCLYLCLRDSDSNLPDSFQWIINSNRIKTKRKKTIGQLSFQIPCSNFGTKANPTIVGSEIYVIGGYGAASSVVRVLDCRSHTWRNAPSMNVARKNPKSCVHDGKVYVIGGAETESSSFGEVFDTNTQTWECLPDPGISVIPYRYLDIVENEGKIQLGHAFTSFAYYDPKQCKWQKERTTFPSQECVVDNVLYSFHKHGGRYNWWWTEINGSESKEVKGLDSLGNRYKRHGGGSSDTTTKTVSCGGKLYVIWQGCSKKNNPNNMVKIWCAEISLEKRDGDEIWGNVEWLDVVHTVPTPCCLLHCLAISL